MILYCFLCKKFVGSMADVGEFGFVFPKFRTHQFERWCGALDIKADDLLIERARAPKIGLCCRHFRKEDIITLPNNKGHGLKPAALPLAKGSIDGTSGVEANEESEIVLECGHCGLKALTPEVLVVHISTNCPGRLLTGALGGQVCGFCGSRFNGELAFCRHYKETKCPAWNEDIKRFKCDLCLNSPSIFFHQQDFERHLIQIHQCQMPRSSSFFPENRKNDFKSNFQCSICSQAFKTAIDLYFHVKIHQAIQNTDKTLDGGKEPEPPKKNGIPCPSCGRMLEFQNQLLVNSHRKACAKARGFCCEFCPLRFKDDTSRHQHWKFAHPDKCPKNANQYGEPGFCAICKEDLKKWQTFLCPSEPELLKKWSEGLQGLEIQPSTRLCAKHFPTKALGNSSKRIFLRQPFPCTNKKPQEDHAPMAKKLKLDAVVPPRVVRAIVKEELSDEEEPSPTSQCPICAKELHLGPSSHNCSLSTVANCSVERAGVVKSCWQCAKCSVRFQFFKGVVAHRIRCDGKPVPVPPAAPWLKGATVLRKDMRVRTDKNVKFLKPTRKMSIL